MTKIYRMADGDTGAGAGGGGATGTAGATGTGTTGDAGAGSAGKTTESWRDTLPDPLKGDAILSSVPDIPTLAKNYVEAQKFIGKKRVEAPAKTWTDKEWGEWHALTGRPETADKYELKLPEKAPEGFAIDENEVKAFREKAFKAGLSNAQVSEIFNYYIESETTKSKALLDQASTSRRESEEKLKASWGAKYDQNLEIATRAMGQFAGPEFVKFINESGVGNHPALVEAFHKVGSAMLEDRLRGKGPGLPDLSSEATAKIEIESLKLDKEFSKALFTAHDPGHKAAVAKWDDLFKKAYPGQRTL